MVAKRDYKKEYKSYGLKGRRNTASRIKARAVMKKIRGAKAIKGKDIHHKDGNPLNNAPSNLSVRSISKNRSYWTKGRKK